MHNLEVLANIYKRNDWVLTRQAQDLSHADSLLQPEPRGNCLNYILGHILVGRDRVAGFLGLEPLLSEVEKARYDTDGEPVTGDEEGVVELSRLMEMLTESTARIGEALKALDPKELEREETLGESPGTLGSWIEFFGWHDTYHVGQTEYLRQLAGMDDKVI
jgi:uncharacterized damage-inducible protein DinB